MLETTVIKKTLLAAAVTSAVVFSSVGNAATSWSTDFESYTTGDVEDFVIGNIVNAGAGWFPGTYGAPGDYNTGYSAIVDEGSPAQGNNQLSVFSDYNGWGPFQAGPGTTVQAFVYRDVGLIDLSDVGTTLTFSFDAKLGNIAAPAQADAFMKVLDSVGGTYNEFVNVSFDSDAGLGTEWSTQSVSFLVDASLVGQLLQIGFTNTATDWGPSGVVYDNLSVGEVSAVPVPAAAWLFGSALMGLIGVSRRRKS
jgi:hypothetical protein